MLRAEPELDTLQLASNSEAPKRSSSSAAADFSLDFTIGILWIFGYLN